MKKFGFIIASVLAIAMLVPMMSIQAQDGEDDGLVKYDAVLVLNAAAGTMVDNGDDSYTLTLEGVPENYTLLFSGPMLVYPISVEALSTAWAGTEGLTANAVVRIEGVNMQLTLSAPQYSEGTLGFTAVVENLITEDPEMILKDPGEAFENPVLSIGWSAELGGNAGGNCRWHPRYNGRMQSLVGALREFSNSTTDRKGCQRALEYIVHAQ